MPVNLLVCNLAQLSRIRTDFLADVMNIEDKQVLLNHLIA